MFNWTSFVTDIFVYPKESSPVGSTNITDILQEFDLSPPSNSEILHSTEQYNNKVPTLSCFVATDYINLFAICSGRFLIRKYVVIGTVKYEEVIARSRAWHERDLQDSAGHVYVYWCL